MISKWRKPEVVQLYNSQSRRMSTTDKTWMTSKSRKSEGVDLNKMHDKIGQRHVFSRHIIQSRQEK